VVETDARTDTIKARWPAAPAGELVAMAMDQKNRRLFSSGRDPQYGAKTVQLDTKTHKLFLSTSDFDPPAAPTEKQLDPLPRAKQENFRVLVFGR
jgi:hypothetical protein